MSFDPSRPVAIGSLVSYSYFAAYADIGIVTSVNVSEKTFTVVWGNGGALTKEDFAGVGVEGDVSDIKLEMI